MRFCLSCRHANQRRRGLEKVGTAGSWNLPTDKCTFPTDEITGAQNFNFAPKFPQPGSFPPKILQEENFPTIFWQPKMMPPAPCRDATAANAHWSRYIAPRKKKRNLQVSAYSEQQKDRQNLITTYVNQIINIRIKHFILAGSDSVGDMAWQKSIYGSQRLWSFLGGLERWLPPDREWGRKRHSVCYANCRTLNACL